MTGANRDMAVIKTLKDERGGYCTDCKARFGRNGMQALIQHIYRTGHTARWRRLEDCLMSPEGRSGSEGRDKAEVSG